ncbi:MAG: hypothetical protein WCF85_08765 [Rhodospirillaceae bacterium]
MTFGENFCQFLGMINQQTFVARMLKIFSALVLLVLVFDNAPVFAGECSSVDKMIGCCKLYLKSEKEKLLMSELDPANRCLAELEGAVDQAKEQKELAICTPPDLNLQSLARSFISFAENNPYYYMRSPRFGMLYPCLSG